MKKRKVLSDKKKLCGFTSSKIRATLSQTSNDFWDLWNLPNCIGAIDGKHVKIQAPTNSGSRFFQLQTQYFCVMLALVDVCYKFTVVYIGSYARSSDGGIFAHSELGKYLETRLGIPEDKQPPGTAYVAPHVIVGDEACPLKTYLMRPYPGSQSKVDNEKSLFNYRLSRARRVAENAFGTLSQKFQICQRTLQSLPENADIIFATCVLHNCLRDQGVALSHMGSSANVRSNLTKIPNQGGSAHQSAFEVREKFKQFFNTSSPSGFVPW
jgi:hypothetical protein